MSINMLPLFNKVRVVDEKGVFDGNIQRYRLKQALQKGPVYATVDEDWRVQITA
jgi:hypothetical protein